jgi:hypothetical protein
MLACANTTTSDFWAAARIVSATMAWLDVVCSINSVLSLPQMDMVLIKMDMLMRRIRVA